MLLMQPSGFPMKLQKVHAVVFHLISVGFLHGVTLEFKHGNNALSQQDAIDPESSPAHVIFENDSLKVCQVPISERLSQDRHGTRKMVLQQVNAR